MTYIPNPLDTSTIELPEDIEEIIETISKNTHEIWSVGRINDGWVYGEEHNYNKKTHPSLIPYENLLKEEKAYDRNTSVQVIKCLLKMGFKINK